MSENENERVEDSLERETAADDSSSTGPVKSAKKRSWGGYLAAVAVVIIIIGGVLYLLEKEGRSSTQIFSGILAKQEANKVVASVNGNEILNSELQTSIAQFTQAAEAQGVDTTTPEVQADIKTQSLDVLVNTELLKQAAAERGIEITDEVANERLEAIKAEIGGEAVLAEKMAELGIDDAKLKQDIRDELMIQQLLDAKFAEANIEVTDAEIQSVYDGAGGTEAGLPALEEVRSQVESQIRSSKQQDIINQFLTELKDKAEVEIK